MKVAAIIVTCNRKQQLYELLEDFFRQSQRPEGILVIDNNSADGTAEFIKTNFPSVNLIELKHNSGLFGGIEIGVKTAIHEGYDAVWLVDDDARLRVDTFECLLSNIKEHNSLKNAVVRSANVSPDNDCFTEPVCIKIGNKWKVYHRLVPDINDKVCETIGGPNIGVFIPRSIVESIGPPRSDMVFCGEEEFNYRLKKAGYKQFRCFASIVYHKPHIFSKVKVLGKTRYISKVPPWHTYYEIRNMIFVDRLYKRRTALRSLFITAIDSAVKLYNSDNKLSTAFHIVKAIHDGFRGKMGMRIDIPRPKNSGVVEG